MLRQRLLEEQEICWIILKANKLLKINQFLLIIFFSLSSCSVLDYFEEEEIKLVGKREKVFELQEKKFIKSSSTVILPDPIYIKDWPQNNHNKSNLLSHFLSEERLKKRWEIKIGKGTGKIGPYIISPIVYKNLIFTIDNYSKIQVRDSKKGNLIWTKLLKDENDEEINFTGGLSAANETLFITSGIGNIYALDFKSGNEIWKKNILTQISSPPVVSNNKIFITTDDNQLVVLDTLNGDEIWSHSGNIEDVSIIGGVNPAIKNGIVYVTYSSGEIYALNENNGTIQWYDNIGGSGILSDGLITDIQSPPVIFDEELYVSSFSGTFAAFNAISGERIWELNLPTINPIIIAGKYIYLLDTNNKLYCIEKKAGKIIWVVQLKQKFDDKDIVWVGPILTSNRLIFASSEGKIISLSPYNGKMLSLVNEDKVFTISPIQAGLFLYFMTEEGELVAYK